MGFAVDAWYFLMSMQVRTSEAVSRGGRMRELSSVAMVCAWRSPSCCSERGEILLLLMVVVVVLPMYLKRLSELSTLSLIVDHCTNDTSMLPLSLLPHAAASL